MSDIDDLLEKDKQRTQRAIRDYRTSGSMFGDPAQLMESILWSVAGVSVIAMIATLPWVGDGKPIPGTAWIGVSLTAILLFGGMAAATRYIRTEVNTSELDRSTQSALGRKR